MNSNKRNAGIAVLGAAAAALIGAGTAHAVPDMQVSIDGIDLFPTAGNAATASSTFGDMSVAIGVGATASADDGFGNLAYADGTGDFASAGIASSSVLNSAWAFGTDSGAHAGFGGSFDTAVTSGTGSLADAGFGTNNDFDTAVAGNGDSALATHDSFNTVFNPPLPASAPPVIPDEDPFEDLHGGGASDWTGAVDKFLVQVDPTLAAGLDAGADNFASADADPFSDLAAAIDPNAFVGGVPNPNDLLGVLAPFLDYGGVVYDLPALLGPGADPLVTGFQDYMVGLDSVVGSLLGGI
jgi:hypothetical protein